jgi:hypothetical protein
VPAFITSYANQTHGFAIRPNASDPAALAAAEQVGPGLAAGLGLAAVAETSAPPPGAGGSRAHEVVAPACWFAQLLWWWHPRPAEWGARQTTKRFLAAYRHPPHSSSQTPAGL